MSEKQHAYKAQITVAIIGLVGVLGTALFANWDKIFPDDTDKLAVQKPKEAEDPKELQKTQITEKPESNMCSVSGLVFDSDSNKTLSNIQVDLYQDLRGVRQRPKKLKAGVATTGPNGKFTINCNWVEESQFPLLIALRHRDWVGTRITSTKIETSKIWEGINVPISMNGVNLKPQSKLKEISVSFSSKKIGSDWVLSGKIVNKSEGSFSCIRARFKMSTSYQDKQLGEPDRNLGFLDVEVQNLKPNETRLYRKKLPKRVGIGLYAKQEC